MFLKSLTLKGFKSFADTTMLEFEPGVTVVVGPNGSGKSNIVDAVAWVLGAQGPRTVRSAKMEDVIFAGTPKRPALGRAEVSLTIDNSAGLLPVDFSEVTLTRTLFRSGDSEYALNGVPCRLLDVQELLSDTGVGRQQHVIVSQGQLDAVLNARPEDRRLIVEEAAGILKYRKRKEKAERRLEATEASLLRLQDLLREVRRQLRPLGRQADAARRHGDLIGELLAVRRYLAGKELASVEARLASAVLGAAELTRAEEEQRQALAAVDDGIAGAEAELALAYRRGEVADTADALSRAQRLGATGRGLLALINERRRSIERDQAASVGRDVIASLEAEAARVGERLVGTEAETEALVSQFGELTEAEALFQVEASPVEDDGGGAAGSEGSADGVGPVAHPAGPSGPEVRVELAALRRGLDSGRGELRRLDDRVAALTERVARLGEESDRLQRAAAEADDAQQPLVAGVGDAGSRRAEAAMALEEAEGVKRQRDAEHHRWSARAEALASALDEARARAGSQRLAAVKGVVGTLLEVVEVDEGWGAAFEAAAGEAMAAIVVDGVDAARRSLAHLREDDATGAVVPLPEGPRDEDTPPDPASTSAVHRLGATPVRAHVRSRQATDAKVDAFLDRLLAGAVVVSGGWTEAVDVALAAPELVVVTRDGDRFATGGWRTGAAPTGATGAAHEEARDKAAGAAVAAEQQAAVVKAARWVFEQARLEEADRTRRRDANAVQRTTLAEERRRTEADRRDRAAELTALRPQRKELVARLSIEEKRITELEMLLPAVELRAAAQAERDLSERLRRDRLAQREAALLALRRDVEVRAAALEQRRTMLSGRLAEIEARLVQHGAQREQVAERRLHLEQAAVVIGRLAELVGERVGRLDALTTDLRQARNQEAQAHRAITARLEEQRRQRSAAERRLSELRERVSRAHMEEAEGRVRLEALVESVRRDLECEPDATRDAPCPALPAGTSPVSRARELERELRLMGPINPLALEEFSALRERHEFLEGQLDDVRSARRELAKVIKAVDAEIVEVFRAAYADVAENFERLFTTLFPGGQGRLRLTDPDHLLDTGIEVEARPSGKNIRRLSLLSGGERSLTALALLFAVFRSRPSPFYLMDEVEAALDDVNLHRFLDLLREFRQEAQLLVVSHQKRTMEAADWLYGVTMQPGGSSRVISERVGASA